MKLLVTGRLYPYIMRRCMKKQLEDHFSKTRTKVILKRAKKEYFKIVKRAPDIGEKENFLVDNFYISAYIAAIYKKVKKKLSLEDFDSMIMDGLDDFSFMKKIMEKEDLTSATYCKEMMEIGTWCEKNETKYPTNWLLSISKNEEDEEVYLTYYRCPLYFFCKNEGIPELINTLCNVDIAILKYTNCNIEKTTTIGEGGAYCQFIISKN
ncbi:L-2-amino-thiazoline-4-carboxylic acid hydrolase [Anaerosacchariphilus polymeriproducens]|uniref:L-2-amino-thiazoline-4-carboxylic acid hydrolase n=1 Tax=Anaerosacchariphilus polymeriproducens TaxID=1812858 RepID=A0A371AV96_9FIRM|nr:L-2-amino-thiazoline-4-carboxylic acid hydrolase [Anaerosacchariphilus polymeriproducens]RDU23486.1 hypothetical protein DWV06_09310 [Anaerosacchariphilus polymeriproducens]